MQNLPLLQARQVVDVLDTTALWGRLGEAVKFKVRVLEFSV